MTSVRRVAQSNGKYEAILRAAIKVFARSGFFNSKVADVAREAGVADGTIYLYFKNKDELLMAAIDSAFHRFIRRAQAALDELTDPREKLRRMAFLHLEGLGSNRDLAIVFQTELRHSAKFLAEFSRTQLKEYFNLIREIVLRGQEAGVFRREVSDKIFANCFFGALDEMVTSWVLSDHDYPLEGAADAVADVLISGLRR